MLHGCIPLIIMDNVHTVFESILDYDAFAVRIREFSLDDIPTILGAYSEEQVRGARCEGVCDAHLLIYTSRHLPQEMDPPPPSNTFSY